MLPSRDVRAFAPAYAAQTESRLAVVNEENAP